MTRLSISKAYSWLSDESFRRLIKNTGWLFTGGSFGALLGFVSVIVKARVLGVELFGILTVVVTFVQIIGQLTNFQTWQGIIKYGAECLQRKHNDDFIGLIKLGLIIDFIGAISGMLLGCIASYALANLLNWHTEMSYMAAFLSFSLLFNFTGTATGILRLFDKFKIFAIGKIISSLIGLIGVVTVYFLGAGIWGFVIVNFISDITWYFIILFTAYKILKKDGYLKYWRTKIKCLKIFINFSYWTYMSSILDIPVQLLDIIIVSTVVSFEASGIYRIIKNISQIISLLADPIYQAVYPQFTSLVAENRLQKAIKYSFKIGFIIFIILGPISLIIASTSFFWLGAFFGEAFESGWIPLSFYLSFKTLSLSFISIHPLFTALGYVKQTSAILFIANIIYIIASLSLGNIFGIIGIVCSYGLQFSIVTTLKIIYIKIHVYKAWRVI